MKKTYSLVTFFLLVWMSLQGQSIEIRRATSPVYVDGVLNEAAWQFADSAVNFMQYFPSDSSLAHAQTKVLILYDDDFIYVAGIMSNLSPTRTTYVTPSLRRDFRGEANDSFSVTFDPYKDHTNGFLFGINPFGVRREALISEGGTGRNSFGIDWDNKWMGEATRNEGYWIAEMAIPFKSLRFTENQEEWYINFYRVDSDYAERSTWSPIPRNFSITNMATHRTMKWDEPTKKPGANLSLIPYVAMGTMQDFEGGEPGGSYRSIGGDIKYGITPSLNLDLTINPDFSQVEVDQQVTNLDRFEIYFPERRQFFLENADLFANFGNRSTRPFFSRRIGVARDTATGQNIQNPIPIGTRLSGKINNNTRVGLISMQAGRDVANGLPSYNYSVATLQQKVFTRSNVSFLFINKQTLDMPESYDSLENKAYNRTAGIDYNLASADNKWNGKAFYHRSMGPVAVDGAFAAGLDLNFSTLKWQWDLSGQSVGAHYNPEVGFVRRTDIRQLSSTIQHTFFPSATIIQSHGPGFDFDMTGNRTYGLLDWDVNLLYKVKFRNTSLFDLRLRRQYTYLFEGFDPSGTGALKLPDNTYYTNNMLIGSYV
ncbi:MAG: carbohydrate binding family 9 domain-containing protein, partial [Cyclobacteriaceae bacterium]|nr:carbohydrate binding family 9 domain-containing protein [Cyclobacteriaceae bacterium]